MKGGVWPLGTVAPPPHPCPSPPSTGERGTSRLTLLTSLKVRGNLSPRPRTRGRGVGGEGANPIRALAHSASAITIAIFLPFLAIGCDRPLSNSPQTTSTDQAVASVTTVKPERGVIRRSISQPGTIQAFEQTPVFSKIAGYVQKVKVDIGDRVAKGDALAELWVPEMEVEVAQKNALVGQAEAEVKQAREAVAVAEADYKSADAKVQATEATRLRADAQLQRAQSQYERLAKAGRGGAIGQEDVEETRLGFEAAKAGLEEVKAQVRSAKAERDASRSKWDKTKVDVLVSDAHWEVAKKNRDMAQTMLGYRQLSAPFDGVVTQRSVDTGHFVQPATGPNGQALFTVMRRDVMRIRVQVPEADADWVNQESTAHIRIPALKTYEMTGKLTRTSWSLDCTARTLLAEIDVPDPQAEIDVPDPQGKLRPGMYVTATITAERIGARTLPLSAVVTEGDVTVGYRTYCFIVDSGKALRTPIETGVRDDQRVEVLRRQTKPTTPGAGEKWQEFTGNEDVIVNPSGLTDGQPVRLSESKPK